MSLRSSNDNISYMLSLSLNCFFKLSELIGVSVTKQMQFKCELRDSERDINSHAACSVGVSVGSGTPPKKSQNVYVITVRIGVPNSIGA